MHTTIVKVKNDDGEEQEWILNHNGDWSGDVHITAPEGSGIETDTNRTAKTVILPASIFLQLAGKVTMEKFRSELISAIENIEFD